MRIRVRGAESAWSEWSEPSWVEAGLLRPEDWSAQFIAAPWLEDTRIDQRPPLLRAEIELRAQVSWARLRTTSLGLHEMEINGIRVGDSLLDPGWSSYASRLRYATHDVSELLRDASAQPGGDRIALGAWLGDGWYRGRLGWNDRVRNQWGSRLALLAQLEIHYVDGTAEIIGSGERWRAHRGPILRSGIYDGERYDSAGLPLGWSRPGFDDSTWQQVEVLPRPTAELVAPDGPPVRVTEVLHPVETVYPDGGSTRFDFGQNLVGRLRVRAARVGQEGLRIRHAEVVQDDELALRPLRTAEALDTWWPPVEGDDGFTWAPRFTFHGFRFADIEGLPKGHGPDDIVAEVIHSDMQRTGWFRCSDARLQRLHDNVVWSMRGNFVDVPTDCPQRDERLGWTGDLQVFAPTAAFLFDCSGVLRSWFKDLAADQRDDGSVPFFIPTVPELEFEPGFTSIWGDVATLTPWDLYEAFADPDMLAEQYPAGRRWVEGLRSIAQDEVLVLDQFQFGDWLDPSAPVDKAHLAKANPQLLATAYYQHSSATLAKAARVLGENEDATRYAELAERIRKAFLAEFSRSAGTLVDDAQTSYAIALTFGLFDETDIPIAGQRLAALVRERGHRIGTGFAGTPVICQALADAGFLDDAYAMLMQTECPSWLYPVERGATTIWERWDSLKTNGRVNDSSMTSFNHYALGAVADFLHRTVAGLAPAAPGYERILFRPRPGGSLTSAGAEHLTPFGRASIDWCIRDGHRMQVSVCVPVGASARLDLDELGGGEYELLPGRHEVEFDLAAPVISNALA
ncbi:family 78 glycoside hydrolase catalytic domain [Microbacterium sp. NPDC091313]